MSRSRSVLNRRRGGATALCLIAGHLMSIPLVAAEMPIGFVSVSGAVLKLSDRNGDGDWLDAFEVSAYAENLPAGINALARVEGDVFVLDPTGAAIHRLRDANGDGDALDAGEVMTYAQPPVTVPPVSLRGLTSLPGARLLTLDAARGELLVMEDVNGDDDALDFSEIRVVADALADAVSLTGRSDGAALVARQNAAIGVSVLIDRDEDGDYLDFAENLSYAENIGAGGAISAATARVAYMIRPSDGAILQLYDRTGDDDALDHGEVTEFALPITGATALSAYTSAEVYVATTGGQIHRLADLTLDGDALDVGENMLVAEGLPTPRGLILLVTSAPCLAGDANGDGAVNLADVDRFADALLGLGPTLPPCRLDMNADGLIDGRDISRFVSALTP